MTLFISSTEICFLTCGTMLFLKKLSASNHPSRDDGSISISLNEGLVGNDWLWCCYDKALLSVHWYVSAPKSKPVLMRGPAELQEPC